MKLTLLILACTICSAIGASSMYTDKYDNMELKAFLTNRRLFMTYVKCLLEQGRCTPEGRDLKFGISDALTNDCIKCTEPQKKGAKTVISHLVRNEPEVWQQLLDKYDPKRIYAKKYENELKKLR